jgi:hypothetical protein
MGSVASSARGAIDRRTISPARVTSSCTGRPSVTDETRSTTSLQVRTGVPSTAATLSPLRSPAIAAGRPATTESITAGTYCRP